MRYNPSFGLLTVLWVVLVSAGPAALPAAETEINIAKVDPVPSVYPGQGMLLLARRNLPDPNFRRTIVLLIRHSNGGTLGLVVNRPTRVTLSEAIPHIEGVEHSERLLYWGLIVAQQVQHLVLSHGATPVQQAFAVLDALDVRNGLGQCDAGRPIDHQSQGTAVTMANE